MTSGEIKPQRFRFIFDHIPNDLITALQHFDAWVEPALL